MPLLTAEELARELKVTVPAIRSWTRQGLPCHRLGRCVRFDPAAALGWFAARNEQATGTNQKGETGAELGGAK